MSTPYLRTCPRCGAELAVVALGPDSAPWLCRACKRGWWVAELTQEARATYRRGTDDFEPHLPVKAAVRAELELAHQRGTSLRPDQKATP